MAGEVPIKWKSPAAALTKISAAVHCEDNTKFPFTSVEIVHVETAEITGPTKTSVATGSGLEHAAIIVRERSMQRKLILYIQRIHFQSVHERLRCSFHLVQKSSLTLYDPLRNAIIL